jgi:hypothetical protein
MQEGRVAIEREATHRLPEILAELLDEPGLRLGAPPATDSEVDLVGNDERGHRWVFQIKASSQPGRVADAARRMRDLQRDRTIPVLVVPSSIHRLYAYTRSRSRRPGQEDRVM